MGLVGRQVSGGLAGRQLADAVASRTPFPHRLPRTQCEMRPAPHPPTKFWSCQTRRRMTATPRPLRVRGIAGSLDGNRGAAHGRQPSRHRRDERPSRRRLHIR
jgi:hypothetical protein